jgi:hypothetical protein
MQIVIALVFGAAVGGLLHYLQGGRASRGVALAPVIGTLAGGATWLALTWLGLTTLSPWLWLASFAAPLVVVPVVLAVLTRVRATHDANERVRLGIA